MPLVSARADAKVLNYGAEVSFTQTYRNTGASALDATYDVAAQLASSHSSYVFPIPFQGTVTGVEASILDPLSVSPWYLLDPLGIDGVTIIGHVRDRQSAPKERPEDASTLPVIMYRCETFVWR